MPQTDRSRQRVRRYAKKKRKNRKRKSRKALVAIAAVSIAAVVVFVLVGIFYKYIGHKLENANYPRKYSEYVEKAAQTYDLEPALIYAVIHTESGFDPNAESSVGARGIMQIMPETFTWLQTYRGCEETYTSDDLFDPEICIDYGCYLLKYFLDKYGTERSAVAAYNAGFQVGVWLENSEYSADGKNLDVIPYPETESYVKKVESAEKMYTKLYYS